MICIIPKKIPEGQIDIETLPFEISKEILDLYREIETVEPIPIIYDTKANIGFKYAVGIDIFNFKIVMKIVDMETFNEQILLHEILHLKKVVLENYPKLYAKENTLKMDIQNLVNAIEHSLISEEIEKKGFNEKERLKKDLDEYIFNKLSYSNEINSIITIFGALLYDLDINKIIDLDPKFKIDVPKAEKMYEEFNNHDWSNKEEAIDGYTKILSILNLTNGEVDICSLDFEKRKRYCFNPSNGELLE